MRYLLISCLLLILGGCTLTPQEQDPLSEGVSDPKEDLVAYIKDNPDDLDSHADLLRLQIKDGDAEGAGTTVAHALKFNGGDYRSHLLAAQYHRWQGDLISAEKSLLTARDLSPASLEPRVALAALYNQTYLETEELEQRRIALDLADPQYKPEFKVDYAYAASALGQADKAKELATELIAEKNSPADRLSRAHVLLCELALNARDEDEAIQHLLAARKLQPDYEGIVQYAARMVTAVHDGGALEPMFDETLATQDRAEMRWAALFGKWMLDVQRAAANNEDPLSDEVDNWWRRLDAVSPSHPDTVSRRYQLMKLDPKREDEAARTAEQLKSMEFGEPPVATKLSGLIRMWRAEDAMRLGASTVTLQEVAQLEIREPTMEGLRVMKVMALFKARKDDECLAELNSWLDESEEDDQFLVAMRWWIMLRNGKALDVMRELEKREEDPTNASLWIEAVAKFHVYRAGAQVPDEG